MADGQFITMHRPARIAGPLACSATACRTAPTAWGAVLCAGALLVFLGGSPAWGYTPESPEVQRMIDRGVAYLEDVEGSGRIRYTGTAQGSHVLLGYAIQKAGRPTDHPKVAEAVQEALDVVESETKGPPSHYSIYAMAISAMLLADVDADRYRPQLESIRDFLLEQQQSHGGWGYPGEPIGDTSQVQYVILALWTLDAADVPVPLSAVEKGCQWLLRTQGRSGGFGYHPDDPGPGGAKLAQKDVRHSLTVAAMGSLLIAGDIFRFYRGTLSGSDDSDLPPAIRKVRVEAKAREVAVKPEEIDAAIAAGRNWQNANPYQRSSNIWHYYTLYADERFQSFMELSKGEQPKEPAWYNRGVEDLMQNQDASGGWAVSDSSREDPQVATSFAILYLLRSTKKAIGNLNEGVMSGGYGLPEDTSNIRVEGSQVKAPPVAGAVDDLLDLLDGEEGSELDDRALPENLRLDADPEKRARQLSRLERMARGGPWQGRRVAVRLLGQSGELDVVPTLIHALSDPDKSVRRSARDGLRFVSRRFDAGEMPDEPTREEIREIQEAWRQWYRNLEPGFVFIDP